jgi:vancomycin resistance protein YoaR
MKICRQSNKALLLFFLLIIILAAGCAQLKQKNSVIEPGTKFEDLDLSGIPYTDLEKRLDQWEEDKLDQKVTLVSDQKEFTVSLKELSAGVDKTKALNDIKANPGQTVQAEIAVDQEKSRQVLEKNLAKLKRQAVNATYKIQNNQFVVKPAVAGKAPAVDKIVAEIDKRTFSSLSEPVQVILEDLPAKVSTEAVKKLAFDGVIGEFQTKFNPGDRNRTANLSRAAKALDQKIIKPGATFSFNDTVGPRTPATGYKEAYVMEGNKYVLGTGGGICQVSSTLYSAILMADLQVTERTPHGVPVDYIPLGQDATVSYGQVDLKFKNNTQNLVYIRTTVQSGSLTIKLYGKKTGKKVTIEPQIEKVIPGEEGRKGYIVKTWKTVKNSGQQANKTLLSRDVYQPAANTKE